MLSGSCTAATAAAASVAGSNMRRLHSSTSHGWQREAWLQSTAVAAATSACRRLSVPLSRPAVHPRVLPPAPRQVGPYRGACHRAFRRRRRRWRHRLTCRSAGRLLTHHSCFKPLATVWLAGSSVGLAHWTALPSSLSFLFVHCLPQPSSTSRSPPLFRCPSLQRMDPTWSASCGQRRRRCCRRPAACRTSRW